MTAREKVEIIKGFAEEILTEEELFYLFEAKEHPVAYDGFEPSGVAPIHFGLLRANNVKKLQEAGVEMVLYLADYFGFINNKLGGDLKHIQTAGRYFVEVWKACGIDTSKVRVVWASELMDGIKYWDRVLRVAKGLTLPRTIKSLTIAGRSDKEELSTAQVFYPSMQVSDIFEMDIDICQLGMDQRRANVIAKETAHKNHWKVPVAAHHHILLGLQGPKEGATEEETLMLSKMSKSKPETCIYMHNTKEEIEQKIKGAFCPPKQSVGNPVLEYARYIIIPSLGKLDVARTPNHGSDKSYSTWEDLFKDFESGNLHPLDLKAAVVRDLEVLIKPVREHFETNAEAKKLYEEVRSYQITR